MSLFNVNQTVAQKARNTSVVPIKDKQFLIVTDSGDIFYDTDGRRVQLTDILTLDTESQRLALTSPFEKFYFVKETGTLWRYANGAWVSGSGASGGGATAVEKTLTVAGWSSNHQDVAIEGLTAAQNGIVGLSQSATQQVRQVATAAKLYVSAQVDGSLQISVGGKKPTCDIPITIILFE